MPAFRYQALDAQGRNQRGTIEADHPKAARSALRAQQLVPLEVQEIGSGQTPGSPPGWWERLSTRPVLRGASLAVWTRQLAGLVGAGLTLERALSSLGEEAEQPRLQMLMAALRAEVNAGAPFAKSLAQHPREFDEIFCAVVAAGEHSGSLGLVLDNLANELEAHETLKSKVLGAALYPAIVCVIAVCIVGFLMTYVVPQVAGVFAGSKRALPLLTSIMLGISALVRSHGLLMLLALAAGGLGLRWWLTGAAARQRFDAAWLRLPLIGRLARSYNAARFASTLSMLSGAGVPILAALQAAAQTVGNQAMRADALEVLSQVREGAPLGAALARKKRYPTLVSMFARMGAETGAMPAMLQRAAQQLSNEVQRRAMHLATLLEPLMIVAMGLMVMLIVLAVLLPIIELNSFVK